MRELNQYGRSNTVFLNIVFVLLFILFSSLAFHYWQSFQKQKAFTDSFNIVRTSPVKTVRESLESTTTTSTSESTTSVSTSAVFTPIKSFNSTEIDEIQEKVVQPFMDYYSDNEIVVTSFTIEKLIRPVSGYNYKVSYVNMDGSTGGFLYGNSSPLDWWVPECLNGCTFTQAFTSRYPEIVAKSK